jgi:hypothetical protein
MKRQRWTTLFVLLVFLPVAAGCSTSRTMRIEADPRESEAAASFQAGDPIEITGYTRPDDGFRAWSGIVQKVPPDSLQFRPVREYKKPEPGPPFRLAMTDVISIDAKVPSAGKTTGLVLGVIAFGGIVAAVIIGYQISQMDL